MIETKHRPPPGYFISYAFAFAGIAFAGIGLWAAVAGMFGKDTIDSVGQSGVICTVLALAIGFSERLTRWSRLGTGIRRAVLAVIVAVLMASLFATLVCLFLAIARSGMPFIPTYFGLAAALCHFPAAYWLLQLRTRP
ncbi:hypothetical protein [Lichenicola sp.]|uniref:hypothetical protein n=1 Tax=Lichenicola sp. TaxID=2804529 RepID=UPI003B009F9D